ncbi:helix-turn-helix transcriptional regulator [Actinocrispum wychmicini]|uniref:DNA-binding NarL/FixJ family response regulator n=1 Tax=Actinocrispum wychmicini TaxID=1213861 RepID=A0A4R2J8Y5_9PSEU|nr:LuxR C-terminal-related transcriptional regulator [Actinocrispum wychmicini]TCO55783.1 DNA-binding NarL/FixJ family response regulator [Actinocrispum wychmicini]
MTRVPLALYAQDPILEAGVRCQLRSRPEIELLDPGEEERAEVVLVVVDRLDDETELLLRRLQRSATARVGLMTGYLEENVLRTTVECGVAAVIRRSEANQDRLVSVITALARGEGVLPGDLLGRLLDQVGRLQRKVLDPRGLTLSTLTVREADMLRLVAEGLDTAQIAVKTSYSERTVKNVLHEVITRFNLRNRAHAVGYLMRHGLI